ncbi:hypothetical protein HGRIS_002846 [Hohenbuehelia grisea]|uniref:Transmembrane protein n=1 Tax=Hohenbuehelia grisea TaxID=104357 RepID=A0ABR3JM93_9AGAR
MTVAWKQYVTQFLSVCPYSSCAFNVSPSGCNVQSEFKLLLILYKRQAEYPSFFQLTFESLFVLRPLLNLSTSFRAHDIIITMPSFKTLSLIATFAFAAFTGASPMPTSELAIRTAPKPLPQVIQDCHGSLKPLTAKLTAAVGVNVGLDLAVITPIIADIKVVLNVAIRDAKACVGRPKKEILTLGVRVFAALDIAKILGALLVDLFAAIGIVLQVALKVNNTACVSLLRELGELIAVLLTVVLDLVGGLLAGLLLPLIAGVLHIVISLNVGGLLKCLGLGLNLGLGINLLGIRL